jgi:adenylate cyclase
VAQRRCVRRVARAEHLATAEKLGDDGHRLIKTVPRRGYLLDAVVSAEDIPAAGPPQVAKRSAGDDSASLLPLPDRPSIAVLPFANLSGDPEQEYLADGIVEDIITELSRFGELFVIARNSTFQYKGKAVDVRQVGRDLGVRYVLEGSVRRGADRVRIAVQLIEALTGGHTWAQRYDRELQDISAVQDEVVRRIVAILVTHLSKAEAERTVRKPPEAWEAYDFCMRAAAMTPSYQSSLKREDLYEIRRLANQALAIDPNNARAHVILSFTYSSAWVAGIDSDYLNPQAIDRSCRAAFQAVRLDPLLPQAQAQLAALLAIRGEHDAAVAALERASELNPNFVNWSFAFTLACAGQAARAIEIGRTYMRLDPFYSSFAAYSFGFAYYVAKDYSEACRLFREHVSRTPDSRPGHGMLAATYAQLGQTDLARVHAGEVLRIQPGYTIASWQKAWATMFKLQRDTDHLIEGLRKAGLPENSEAM